MATSPKKTIIGSMTNHQFRAYHGQNLICFVTICILSAMLALFIIFSQIKNVNIYLDHLNSHGKQLDSMNMATKDLFNTVETDDKEKNLKSTPSRKDSEFKVKAVSILGERNSGTNWIYDHLNECFNHSLPIKRKLTRYKHWFQDENVGEPITTGTLVLALFRNPFEWVEAMRKKPHHAPEHMFITHWNEFVSKPWTMKRVGKDLNMTMEERSMNNACQEYFMYKDIISCHIRPYPDGFFKKTHYSEHQPFYEMRNDGSGQPFDNILEMRSAKIRNFLSTSEYAGVVKLLVLQYEKLVEIGTKELVHTIHDLSGVDANCDVYPPQDRKKRTIQKELIEYLMKNLDWDAENKLGYFQSGMRNPQ